MLTHDQAIQAFYDEAGELLTTLESALLELENDPHHTEHIAEAFRALHTIKGPASMLGFTAISSFTHEIETFFDSIRAGELLLDSSLLSLMLEAKDHIALLVSQGLEPAQQTISASQNLLAKIQQHVNYVENQQQAKNEDHAAPSQFTADRPPEQDAPGPSEPPLKPSAETPPAIYRIRFNPANASLLSGSDPLALLDELHELGSLYCMFQYGDLPALQELQTDLVYGSWDILLNSSAGIDAVRDVFIFIEDDSEIEVEELDKGVLTQKQAEQLLAGISRQTVADAEPAAPARQSEPEMPAPPDPPEQKPTAPSTPEQEQKAEHVPQALPPASTSIRVDSARLDTLVNMVGEMVIIQSSLSQAASGPLDPTVISRIAEDLERLTDEMRENALGLRMLPIGTIYSNFKRLVHDLSKNLGKEVELITHGAETELDKTVIDRLKDPLVHILRNCVDHGIEDPHERQAAGKPQTGRISLSSVHSGGDVVITIQDDGRGMDPDQIKEKALQRGLIPPDYEPDLKEIFELILTPGFSTAKVVSDVSGRGVGMDIVKRSIDELRGRITFESSLGTGTTMTIRLPLTLAIVDGFNVVVEEQSFIVPLANLRGFQERFIESEIKTIQSVERMGELLPCVSLRRLFEFPGLQPGYERIIICDVEGTLIGLAVDNVIGRQQAVIKSLDSSLRNLKWISGTTINGDGSISLILDVPQLVRHASKLNN